MKSFSARGLIAGSAYYLAFAALNGAALAEPKAKRQVQADSLGYQCRAGVRSEM